MHQGIIMNIDTRFDVKNFHFTWTQLESLMSYLITANNLYHKPTEPLRKD